MSLLNYKDAISGSVVNALYMKVLLLHGLVGVRSDREDGPVQPSMSHLKESNTLQVARLRLPAKKVPLWVSSS